MGSIRLKKCQVEPVETGSKEAQRLRQAQPDTPME